MLILPAAERVAASYSPSERVYGQSKRRGRNLSSPLWYYVSMDADSELTTADRSPPVAIDPQAVADARAVAPPEELLALVVETFKALGDATRVRILYALIRRPLCVRDLAIIVGVS